MPRKGFHPVREHKNHPDGPSPGFFFPSEKATKTSWRSANSRPRPRHNCVSGTVIWKVGSVLSSVHGTEVRRAMRVEIGLEVDLVL